MPAEHDQEAVIQAALLEFLGPNRNALAANDWLHRLDVSRPNVHDSKKDFLKEQRAVQAALDHVEGAFRSLFPEHDDPESRAMIIRMAAAIDEHARRSRSDLDIEKPTDLVRKNMADIGFYFLSLKILLDLGQSLRERLKELEYEESRYWNVKHRPANYYARAIALRLARLYAREKEQRPTFGTARDGGHPSTDYGRALEKIFGALEIKSGVKGPAKWAIAQLTDDNLNPPAQNILGGVLGLGQGYDAPPDKYADIVQALSKRLE